MPDEWLDGCTYRQPRSNMPPQLLQSWGHKKDVKLQVTHPSIHVCRWCLASINCSGTAEYFFVFCSTVKTVLRGHPRGHTKTSCLRQVAPYYRLIYIVFQFKRRQNRRLLKEVIKLEYILKLKIKHTDWLLPSTCSEAANQCALF